MHFIKQLLLFPLALTMCALPGAAQEGWYVFQPENNHEAPSIIGLEDWANEPAGAHGRIERKDDKLLYNGDEIKLWGTNIGFQNSCPDKRKAKKIVALYKKFGLNALRHHKHLDGPGYAGFQSDESFVEFNAEKLDRFDYFNSLLKDAGIYLLHSPTFGVKFGRKDLARVPYHAEIGELGNKKDARIRAGHGWVFVSKEIQDLQIEQTVKFLNHVNPYTKMRYADDPAWFCVELFNEDSALFGATSNAIRQSPTIQKRMGEEFTDWLAAKYESEEKWRSAWGDKAIIEDPDREINEHLKNLVHPEEFNGGFVGESFVAKSVMPMMHPWFADAAVTEGTDQYFLKQRMLDTMAFFVGLQDAFYGRFIEAIRGTGFEGEIITSNWQAGSLVGHLLNLHSDSQTGIIDRHNYYKGGGFQGLKVGNKFNNATMLNRAGGGNYTVGFQQVEGNVFSLSEWTHEQPNEWYAEGPVVMGAYGYGLQGWDVSYHFLFGPAVGFSNQLGKNTWDGSNPAILGMFPTVSRMVRRMDVHESPETFHLNAHIPSLMEGKMSFRGETIQHHDEKLFSSDKAPVEALAAVRVAINFTDEYVDTPEFDLGKYQDGRTVKAANGQLSWTAARDGIVNDGHLLVTSRGTKSFVGFASGEDSYDLGDGFIIKPQAGFSVIVLTADNPEKDLFSDDSIIVTAMARVRNTGMELNDEGNVVVKKGTVPMMLEAVRAEIRTPFGGTLEVLDQDGKRVVSSREFSDILQLDSALHKTPFYRISK